MMTRGERDKEPAAPAATIRHRLNLIDQRRRQEGAAARRQRNDTGAWREYMADFTKTIGVPDFR